MDNNLIKIAPALCMISTEDFEKHPAKNFEHVKTTCGSLLEISYMMVEDETRVQKYSKKFWVVVIGDCVVFKA
jgi:hypothetical protein